MTTPWPRAAFFADSYYGVDGVATTSRNLVEEARRQGLPFMIVRAGDKSRRSKEGSVEVVELARGPVSFNIDLGLRFDLLFSRHFKKVVKNVRDFGAEVVHITGPGDIGITGARVAHALKLSLVASWHTNLHEFAAHRIQRLCWPLPEKHQRDIARMTERFVLSGCLRFYKLAHVILAPNQDQIRQLGSLTGKPVLPMRRGVDATLFSPVRRDVQDSVFRLGFVGRLRPEKNVRFLARIERALIERGMTNIRFLIVGDGSERLWLERNMRHAEFTGVLRGQSLARAYANMDLFLFPSETDTFGNVILEAMASGVPAIVTAKGGPKYLVQNCATGFVAENEDDFIAKAILMMTSPELHLRLTYACRDWARSRSWGQMLEDVREAYQACLCQRAPARACSVALAAHST